MNKNNRRSLRLGSFELLESRAMLAHAGLPQGMSYAMHEDRQVNDFNRGPRVEMQARDVAWFGGDRGPRGDHDPRDNFSPPIRNAHAAGFETVPVVFIPAAPVLIIITLPASVPAAPQVSEPLTSSVRNTPPQSQQVSSINNPPSSSLQASSTSNRASSTSKLSLNSLSVFSETALKRVSSSDSVAADDAESAGQVAQDADQPTRDEQESQLLNRQPAANETGLQPIETDEEADLIELDPAELLKRTKRKAARAATAQLESSPARESAFQFERRLPRAAEMQLAESWLSLAQVDEVIAPVNDDLIELLTAEIVEVNPSTALPSTPFAASATLQLEATVGFHQAEELTDAAIPVEAQPAAVATATLQARDAQ